MVAIYAGQHHVHAPHEFEVWCASVKPDRIIETGTPCECGLTPGQVRDHTGHVSTLKERR